MADTIVSLEEALHDRHPQRIGDTGRFCLGKQRRLRAVAAHSAAGMDALAAHAAAGLVAPLATEVLRLAQTQLGHPYAITYCRCVLNCANGEDCSGLICASVNGAGLAFPCTSSFAIADIIRQHGTSISEDEAIHTPGAVGIENPWGTPSVNGANGHIVWMDGDGLLTTEEMGHRNGCCHGPATGRGFSLWARLPGLDYRIPTPVQEDDMPQLIGAPARMQTIPFRHAHAELDAPNKKVLLHNGATVSKGDGITGSTITVPSNTEVFGWLETFNSDGTKKGFIVQARHLQGENTSPSFEYEW